MDHIMRWEASLTTSLEAPGRPYAISLSQRAPLLHPPNSGPGENFAARPHYCHYEARPVDQRGILKLETERQRKPNPFPVIRPFFFKNDCGNRKRGKNRIEKPGIKRTPSRIFSRRFLPFTRIGKPGQAKRSEKNMRAGWIRRWQLGI